jgi:uncharacterized membrane protein YdbT with pleckstrin-like domain
MIADDIVGKDEQVTDVVQRHWVNIIPLLAGSILIGLAALYGFYALGRYGDQVSAFGPTGMAVLALVALVVLAALLGYISLWVYRQNKIIITDKNLYLVTQNSLFSRKVDQFTLDKLQEVTATQHGFFANILDYGDVKAETAGDEMNLNLRYAPRPNELAARIMECHQQYISPDPDNAKS